MASKRLAGDFWAITGYFNPMRFRRRYDNYRLFRERLNMPLVAIELAYGPDFELGVDDAEILLKRRGDAILWQRERLLNLALEALPSTCRKVAWIDCDVIFDNDDWIESCGSLLDRYALVQPFRQVYLMPKQWQPGMRPPPDAELRRSVPCIIASGVSAETCLGTPASKIHCAPGYIWAASRELISAHQLYDACIVGAGSAAIACAAYGCFEEALRLQPLNRDHFLNWAIPFHKAVNSNVGFLNATLYHLWHGDPANRQYRSRHEGLTRYKFDPLVDVAINQDGIWRWSSDKPAMHEFVRTYFSGRKEDG